METENESNQVKNKQPSNPDLPKRVSTLTRLATARAAKKKGMEQKVKELQKEKPKQTYIKSIGKILGNILWIGSGAILLILWIIKMTNWMGSWGTVLSIILSPGVAVFPFVFWIVERVFPLFYFILWALGLVGLLIKASSSE